MEDFYTYIYYNPLRNNIPIYVGKGRDNRAWEHLFRKCVNKQFGNRIKTLKLHGVLPIIGLYSGIDEEFSILLEEELIRKFGRRDLGTGSLYNMTDGGDGISGYSHTIETKRIIGEHSRRKIVSEETKLKMSQAKLGRKFSNLHKENLSKSHTGKKRSHK